MSYTVAIILVQKFSTDALWHLINPAVGILIDLFQWKDAEIIQTKVPDIVNESKVSLHFF